MLRNDNRANLKLNLEQWSDGLVGSDFLRRKERATGESQAHYIWQDMTVVGLIRINIRYNAYFLSTNQLQEVDRKKRQGGNLAKAGRCKDRCQIEDHHRFFRAGLWWHRCLLTVTSVPHLGMVGLSPPAVCQMALFTEPTSGANFHFSFKFNKTRWKNFKRKQQTQDGTAHIHGPHAP